MMVERTTILSAPGPSCSSPGSGHWVGGCDVSPGSWWLPVKPGSGSIPEWTVVGVEKGIEESVRCSMDCCGCVGLPPIEDWATFKVLMPWTTTPHVLS